MVFVDVHDLAQQTTNVQSVSDLMAVCSAQSRRGGLSSFCCACRRLQTRYKLAAEKECE